MRPRFRNHHLILGFLLTAMLSCGAVRAEEAPYVFQKTDVRWKSLNAGELSGLAVSYRDPGFFWMLNDSGNGPFLLFADSGGGDRGRISVRGASNSDWEDLDSFQRKGKAFLMIADTGDNHARRRSVRILGVEEPFFPNGRAAGEVRPAWRMTFTYPGGPRDCEAVAADADSGLILLVSKRTNPPRLYELPLPERSVEKPIVARDLGPVSVPSESFFWGPFASQPVSLAVRPDGRLAALLTYHRVLLYYREAGETWAAAMSKPPVQLRRHGLMQAEAIAFSADGRTIFVTTEGLGGELVSYRQ